MTYNMFSGTLNPTHFTVIRAQRPTNLNKCMNGRQNMVIAH